MLKIITTAQVRRWLPVRSSTAHKGQCGRILIVAGSRGMSGAAVLSAWGAVRTGAGLVRVGIVKGRQDILAKRGPLEVTSFSLPETKQGFISPAAWSVVEREIESFRPTVIAAGPGLGSSDAVKKLIRGLINKTQIPLVLDADALNVLTRADLSPRRGGPVVLTPHIGELSRLLKWPIKKVVAERSRAIFEITKSTGVVCVLKGHHSLISDGQMIWKNSTGTSAMASAGMGDVLTGMTAALLGQALSLDHDKQAVLSLASAAVYLHGLAGEIAHQSQGGLSVTASDITQFIPRAIQRIQKSK